MRYAVLGIINYGVLLFFGNFIATSFIGIERTRDNNIILIIFSLFIYSLQILSYVLLGAEYTAMLYPLITHLPSLLLFVFYYRKKFFSCLFSIMSAYLCCEISHWFGVLALFFSNEIWVLYVVRITVTIPIWYCIVKYVAPSISLIFSKSKKTILIFGILPLSYYIFDYSATVYTKLLFSGSPVIYEFLPLFLCIAYLFFNTVYFKEYEQKCEAERYYQIMELHKAQSIKEIEAIRHLEYEISLVSHDMRHFLNNILSYIENENNDKAKSYIRDVIEMTNKTIIHKFCSNELVNMVLSSYQIKMKDYDTKLKATVEIPTSLPFSDVEFTSILANGLENAIQAVSKLEVEKRIITLDLYMIDNKLLLSIKNPYTQKVIFENGTPTSRNPGHGLGTQSIKYVTTKLNGNCQFTADDGIFALRIVL